MAPNLAPKRAGAVIPIHLLIEARIHMVDEAWTAAWLKERVRFIIRIRVWDGSADTHDLDRLAAFALPKQRAIPM